MSADSIKDALVLADQMWPILSPLKDQARSSEPPTKDELAEFLLKLRGLEYHAAEIFQRHCLNGDQDTLHKYVERAITAQAEAVH